MNSASAFHRLSKSRRPNRKVRRATRPKTARVAKATTKASPLVRWVGSGSHQGRRVLGRGRGRRGRRAGWRAFRGREVGGRRRTQHRSNGSKGEEPSDEESEDDDAKAGGASEPEDEESEDKDGDFEGEDDAGDEEGENEGSGSGGQGDDEDESYEGDEEEAGSDSGKSPEELDKEAAEEVAKMAKQMFGHEEQEQEAGNYTEPEDGLVPMGDPQGSQEETSIDQAIKLAEVRRSSQGGAGLPGDRGQV